LCGPFLTLFAPLTTGGNDGKIMLIAEIVANASYIIVALSATVVFVSADVIGGTENNVVVYVFLFN
jgi:hypothetical protein